MIYVGSLLSVLFYLSMAQAQTNLSSAESKILLEALNPKALTAPLSANLEARGDDVSCFVQTETQQGNPKGPQEKMVSAICHLSNKTNPKDSPIQGQRAINLMSVLSSVVSVTGDLENGSLFALSIYCSAAAPAAKGGHFEKRHYSCTVMP